MPLKSEALRDNHALQQCLLHDPAHVVPGAKGNHVSRIQKALIFIERANISVQEMKSQLYGPTTKAAVLAYKKKRKIINTSYQTAADNIVGKMTIAKMDQELLALERKHTPDKRECGGGSGGGGVDRTEGAHSLVEAPGKGKHLRQWNAKVNVMFQETQAAENLGGGMNLLFNLFEQGRKLLKPHGIDFAGGDGGLFSMIGPRIPDFEKVITGSSASCFSVRAASERVAPGRPTTLRVIFCPWDDKSTGFGVTDGGTVGDWSFPKFCLINVLKGNPDFGTLIHEMVHAAKPVRIEHDTDKRSVFSEETGGRDFLPAHHAESIAGSYFSVIHF